MELNREQIIKALECISRTEDVLCEGCDYRKYDGLACHRIGAKNALSLIKELTAKIAEWEEECDLRGDMWCKLNEENKRLTEENERLSAYNENLIKENTYLSNHLLDEVEQAKDLAISCTVRQMKERIKEEAKSIYLLSDPPKIMLELREDVLGQIAREIESEVSNYDN
jgi:cell division protein FtsB